MTASLNNFVTHTTQALNLSATTLWSQPLCCCLVLLLLCLQGCSTLPRVGPETPRYSNDIATVDTRLAQKIMPLAQQQPELTGYHTLYDPLEALAARLSLINKAEKTLDLQYYIWNNDHVGALAWRALIAAADRGVKIRLLIDDNNTRAMDGIYLALSQHQNIEIKFFNPYQFRQHRVLDLILNPRRLNRRMHNKTFIADQHIALIGGRNMSDEYFNVSDDYQFSDLDVLLVGQAVRDINQSFDDYWNHRYAYSVANIINPADHTLRYDALKQQLETHYAQADVQQYLDLTQQSNNFEQWLNQELALDWVNAEVVKDSPDKIMAKAKKQQHVNFQLLQKVNPPQQQLDLVSAYFVPEKNGAKMLTDMAQRGVKVRVLTNSYAANDVPLVHAFYAKYRQQLLQSGVQLYEFLPALDRTAQNKNNAELAKKVKVSQAGLSRSSLHAKLLAADQNQVFIGSFNFDPRSAYTNTEIGVILNSPKLAQTVHNTLDSNLNKYAYQLSLNPSGELQWNRITPVGIRTTQQEPRMTWWQKWGLHLVTWLPLEGLM